MTTYTIKELCNPWKDIASYESTERDRKLFRGRDSDVEKFLNILSCGIFSVIYSSSGIGKTSFLRAGIEPYMRDIGYLPVHIVFHNTDNIEKEIIINIEESLSKNGVMWVSKITEWELLKSASKDNVKFEYTKSLWWKLRTSIPTDKEGKQYKILLVFDQFEEVFQEGKIALAQQREHLFKILQSIYSLSIPKKAKEIIDDLFEQGLLLSLEPQDNYKVIFALRKEYLSDFDYWTNDRCSITDLFQNRMLLQPMTREQAKKVIT